MAKDARSRHRKAQGLNGSQLKGKVSVATRGAATKSRAAATKTAAKKAAPPRAAAVKSVTTQKLTVKLKPVAKGAAKPSSRQTVAAKSSPKAAVKHVVSATSKGAKTPAKPSETVAGKTAKSSRLAAKPPALITSPRPASKSKTPALLKAAPKSAAAQTAPARSSAVPPRHSQPASSPPAGKTMSKTSSADYHALVLPEGYRPSDDEDFMNPMQRAYFRAKLQKWKDDIIKETMETLQVLHDDTIQHPDLADRATHETDRALELRARDRQRKLISKIDQALRRIDDGSYGYCADTGEPINLRRLDARPVATLSVEAQERHERRERVYRDE
jgi:DnaK suppressor protein